MIVAITRVLVQHFHFHPLGHGPFVHRPRFFRPRRPPGRVRRSAGLARRQGQPGPFSRPCSRRRAPSPTTRGGRPASRDEARRRRARSTQPTCEFPANLSFSPDVVVNLTCPFVTRLSQVGIAGLLPSPGPHWGTPHRSMATALSASDNSISTSAQESADGRGPGRREPFGWRRRSALGPE